VVVRCRRQVKAQLFFGMCDSLGDHNAGQGLRFVAGGLELWLWQLGAFVLTFLGSQASMILLGLLEHAITCTDFLPHCARVQPVGEQGPCLINKRGVKWIYSSILMVGIVYRY